MKVSLIIVTYNQPNALSLILKSIEHQTVLPDEVIIADDGSTSETAQLIASTKQSFPVPLLHVWHEDKGFRAATIRNRAVRKSTGDYLIFSDGDLFFHPQFIHDFKKSAKKDEALIGSRVFLSKRATLKRIQNNNYGAVFPLLSTEIETNRINSVRLPILNKLYKPLKYSSNLRGGLLGVWKNDLERVNGWNEEFLGWGLEDTELVARLFNSGLLLRKIKFQAITYHLWHKTQSREQLSKNKQKLEKAISDKTVKCIKGLAALQ